jgi:hypothetical protein
MGARKYGFWGILFTATLFLSACAGQPSQPVIQLQTPVNVVPNTPPDPNAPIARDEHGCLTSAGDAWCEILQKCYRPGAEACETKDEHGCVTSSGSYWCDKQKKCYDPNIDFCDITKNFCPKNGGPSVGSCGRLMTPTCGWLTDNGKCANALCIRSYTNPCNACADPDIKYYTAGFCPSQKLNAKK